MPKVLKWGSAPEPKPPWYERAAVRCRDCNTIFQLDAEDFADGSWFEVQENPTGGAHTATGQCPLCHVTIVIDIDKMTTSDNIRTVAEHLAADRASEGAPRDYVDDSDG